MIKRPYKRLRRAAAGDPVADAFKRESSLRMARSFLLSARHQAKLAGAPFLLPRISAALGSCRGALNNARHRIQREARARPE